MVVFMVAEVSFNPNLANETTPLVHSRSGALLGEVSF